MKKRKLVVGDIHGALKALIQALERCHYNALYDELLFLGDYVDGWSESAEVVDFLCGLKNAQFIMGNHDLWCKQWLLTGKTPHIWLSQGGKATVNSYLNMKLQEDKKHIDFFNNLKNWIIDDENRIFIHGGWDYRADEFPASAVYPVDADVQGGLECHWNRNLLSGAKSGHNGGTGLKALNQFKEIYIGHTATKSHLPENYCNLWNMDSGCGWHGKLTVMDVDTKEYWQSDYSHELYNKEKGRM